MSVRLTRERSRVRSPLVPFSINMINPLSLVPSGFFIALKYHKLQNITLERAILLAYATRNATRINEPRTLKSEALIESGRRKPESICVVIMY